jgi:hypothetical protein
MTALAASVDRARENNANVIKGAALIATSSVLYNDALVCHTATGTLVPAADSTAITFAGMFTGVNGNRQRATGDGVLVGEFETGFDVCLPCAATVVAALRNDAIYAADDEGVTNVTTLGPQIGIFLRLESATFAWVRLGAFAMLDAT